MRTIFHALPLWMIQDHGQHSAHTILMLPPFTSNRPLPMLRGMTAELPSEAITAADIAAAAREVFTRQYGIKVCSVNAHLRRTLVSPDASEATVMEYGVLHYGWTGTDEFNDLLNNWRRRATPDASVVGMCAHVGLPLTAIGKIPTMPSYPDLAYTLIGNVTAHGQKIPYVSLRGVNVDPDYGQMVRKDLTECSVERASAQRSCLPSALQLRVG